MKKKKIIIGILMCMASFIIAGCEEDDPEATNFSFTFANEAEGWTGDFADYPIGEKDSYELRFEHVSLPSPLDMSEGALMMTGSNQSDDLFMFLKRKITGLAPGSTYSLKFTIEFASDAADDMVGIGGSPGESVFVKAGATQIEPVKVEASDNYYRMNIDKGNQSQGGEDMIVIGDFSNDTNSNTYTLVTRTNESSFYARADSNGELWIVVGTDSGFEGTTTIYYNEIVVVLQKS